MQSGLLASTPLLYLLLIFGAFLVAWRAVYKKTAVSRCLKNLFPSSSVSVLSFLKCQLLDLSQAESILSCSYFILLAFSLWRFLCADFKVLLMTRGWSPPSSRHFSPTV